MAKGAALMVIFKFAGRAIGIVSTMILARLLVPDDFGLIAMATSVIALLELMSAFGFDMALIQNQNAEKKHYNTAWTYNVIFGVSSATILVLVAEPAAVFYKQANLEIVIYVLALGAFIRGFENIGVVDFRKEMRFKKEFYFLLSQKIIGFCCVIPAAYFLGDYWALVIGIMSLKISAVVLSYIMHPYRPWFSVSASNDLFHFSKWLLLTNTLDFLKTRSADFVIGRELGPNSLGLYSVSFEISEMPSTEVVMPINRAIFPGFAKLSHDLKLLRNSFLQVLSMIAVFALPTGAGLAATVDLVVPILLGDKWLAAIPILQILAFAGIATAMQTSIAYVYIAINKPKITTFMNAIFICILLPCLLWFTQIAAEIGAAYAFLLATCTLLPLNFIVVSRHIHIRLSQYVAAVWRPFLASSCMFTIVYQFNLYIGGDMRIHQQLGYFILEVIMGAFVYSFTLLILWYMSGKPDGAEKNLIQKFKEIASQRIPRFLRRG